MMTRREFLWSGLLFSLVLALGLVRAPAAERLRVESSVLAAVTYDAKARTLDVEFHSGAIYRYLAVPLATYEALIRAESKGRYFNANIRDRFQSQPLPRASAENSHR